MLWTSDGTKLDPNTIPSLIKAAWAYLQVKRVPVCAIIKKRFGLVLVVDDEPDVEVLFRQQFRNLLHRGPPASYGALWP